MSDRRSLWYEGTVRTLYSSIKRPIRIISGAQTAEVSTYPNLFTDIYGAHDYSIVRWSTSTRMRLVCRKVRFYRTGKYISSPTTSPVKSSFAEELMCRNVIVFLVCLEISLNQSSCPLVDLVKKVQV